MFAVVTHSRLRSPLSFPTMLRATLAVRRDLQAARGLFRAANVIAGPTEFLTVTVWSDRDAMHEFMRSGAHERVMWRWPDWLSAFWLARLAPTDDEAGTWRGARIASLSRRGGPAHAAFEPPEFASREPRPRDLERHGIGATIAVLRADRPAAWPRAASALRRLQRLARATDGLVRSAGGYSLDGELVHVTFWRDTSAARAQLTRCAELAGGGVQGWSMCWRPLDEFGTWDGQRLRHLVRAER